jgi:O-antigen ligase
VVAAILALMMFVAPAAGVPAEEMIQDTLKSAIVAFAALLAALVFFWSRRGQAAPLRWHAGLALPLVLMAYALGSMAWAHAYLGGVEAIRWFLFALLMGLAMNTFTRERLPLLAWGIAAGAGVASLWAVLQFLFDFSLFPQGPHPASTFVNRNFFAEFAVCALPFIAILLARARRSGTVALLSLIGGIVILAVFMTGARAALVALWLQLVVLFPWIAWRCRSRLALKDWPLATRAVSAAILVGVVAGLGVVPTADKELAAEGRGVTGIERAFKRTASIAPGDSSLSIRKVMWRATGRMIAAHPVTGVGAGAWEVFVPLYQAEGAQLETDFYVHNEFLQLVAEYGLVGWVFLVGLFGWMAQAAWRTWQGSDGADEVAWRAVLLTSLTALFVVSNVGFAWRLAATGAIFALCLGALAASDLRLGAQPRRFGGELAWQPSFSLTASAVVVAALGLATHITWLAATAEKELVRAARLAITISAQADPADPRWNDARREMLGLLRDGVRINPHYRKLTPIAADELARWGDWRDAIWVWESVLSSRPFIVAILTNVTRGYLAVGEPHRAAEYLERAKHLQPTARAVRSAEVLFYARTGQDAKALEIGRQALAQGIYDFDMANAVFVIGRRNGDFAIAEQAMRIRLAGWDVQRVQGYVQLGEMLDRDMREADKAAGAYARALTLTPPPQRGLVWALVPAMLRARIDPALTPDQTSASKG